MKNRKLVPVLVVVASLFVTALIIINASPLLPVAGDPTHSYYKNWTGVYIYTPRDCGFPGGCVGPDLDIFRYRRIEGASPFSFRIIQDGGGAADSVLAADADSVFFGGRRVPDGDVKTLEVVTRGAVAYARDANNLYLFGAVRKNAGDWEGTFLGGNFLLNSRGLFIIDGGHEPRKVDLPDPATFRLFETGKMSGGHYFIAEDKNFLFQARGGIHPVEPKPGVRDFAKLGCKYYKFENRIYHEMFLLPGADPETFRVLKSPDGDPHDPERCGQSYAVDKNGGWQSERPVRGGGDADGNRQIERLLKFTINQ